MPIRNAFLRSQLSAISLSLSLSLFPFVHFLRRYANSPTIFVAFVVIVGVILSLFYSCHRLSSHFAHQRNESGEEREKKKYENGENNVIL